MKLKTLDQQCAEMEALLPRVTAWPWGWDFRVGRLADIDPTIQDGTFICQARTLLPQLLKERREMQGEIERLKSWGVPNDARMCANCGRSEPCKLNEDELSPCTLDATYLELIEKVKILKEENQRLKGVKQAYEAQQTKDLKDLVFLGESRAKLKEENYRLREGLREARDEILNYADMQAHQCYGCYVGEPHLCDPIAQSTKEALLKIRAALEGSDAD